MTLVHKRMYRSGWLYDVITLQAIQPVHYETATMGWNLLGAPTAKRLVLTLNKNELVNVRFPLWKQKKSTYTIEEVARLSGLSERFVAIDSQ